MGYSAKISIIEYNSFLIYTIINVNETRDLNLTWQDSLHLMEFAKHFIKNNSMNPYCHLVLKISFDLVLALWPWWGRGTRIVTSVRFSHSSTVMPDMTCSPESFTAYIKIWFFPLSIMCISMPSFKMYI